MKKLTVLLSFLLLITGAFAVQVAVGSGISTTNYSGYPSVYGGYYMNAREQYIVNPAEFAAVGGGAGDITSIAFNVAAVNACGPLPNFTISMGHTANTQYTDNTFITVTLSPKFTPAVE
jgi:hypothetical protein